jgi:acyl dehydratase
MTTGSSRWDVGAALAPWTPPAVTRTDIVRYQGASGDFDAAHHDDEHARKFGYPGVFSLGMLHAGMLGAFVTRHFPPASIRRFRTRFLSVVYPGDVLSYQGKVAAVREEAGLVLIDLELACVRADGAVAIQGSATVTAGS